MASITPINVKLDSVFIESVNDKRLDITDLFISLTVNENIFTPLLNATLLLGDAAALIANLPIVGQETIEILITKNDEEHMYTFKTAGVERQTPVNDFTSLYNIKLVQESMYSNGVRLISQSFKGPMSEIISTIYQDFLGEEIEAEPSAGNYSVVIPRWNPYRAIQWCARRARTDDNAPMFPYTTLNGGTKLKSFKTLFEQEPVEEYYRRKQKLTTTDADAQRGDHGTYNEMVQTPMQFLPLENTPLLEQIHQGAYASRTLLLDIAEKTYTEFDFNYNNEFERMPHLSNEPVYNSELMFDDRPIYENYDTVQKTYVHSSQAHSGSLSYNSDVLNISPFIDSYMQTLNNYRYRLRISGRFDIEVGSVVYLHINKNRVITQNDPDDIKDLRRSGKHIITALKHQFAKKNDSVEYTINFDCARDTMEIAQDEQ